MLKSEFRLIALIALLVLAQACGSSSSDEDIVPVNKKLVSYNESGSLTSSAAVLGATFLGYGDLANILEHDIKTYKVVYKTNLGDKEVEASGIVSLPEGDKAFPLAMIHRGTIFSDGDAPSEESFSTYALAGSAGYIGITPDLIGFGTSKDENHPYYLYEPTAKASVDMLVAVKEMLQEMGKKHTSEMVIAGYSQGGYSALATLKWMEENEENHGFEILGVAAGAGGFDIKDVALGAIAQDDYPSMAYLAFVTNSYVENNDWNRPRTDFFHSDYASGMTNMLDGRYGQGEVNDRLPDNVSDLFNPDFLTGLQNGNEAEFLQALEKNSVADWAPKAKVRLYHGTGDEIIPMANTIATKNLMIENGAEAVEFKELQADSHAAGAMEMLKEVFVWMRSLE
ncbi:hypothetical protein FUAX_23740 [Fulvitalea axinellae]|uniref:Uncharacterized protein n=1 Tax=Fulvitalea axinellae TaxID=1182444 RepID=A0AAU9CPQ6_9BACT|nr:hypothetical protein FUAX_23740 [Fulvitalea axinellae]